MQRLVHLFMLPWSFHITIMETTIIGGGRMNPVAMTIISPWKIQTSDTCSHVVYITKLSQLGTKNAPTTCRFLCNTEVEGFWKDWELALLPFPIKIKKSTECCCQCSAVFKMSKLLHDKNDHDNADNNKITAELKIITLATFTYLSLKYKYR